MKEEIEAEELQKQAEKLHKQCEEFKKSLMGLVFFVLISAVLICIGFLALIILLHNHW